MKHFSLSVLAGAMCLLLCACNATSASSVAVSSMPTSSAVSSVASSSGESTASTEASSSSTSEASTVAYSCESFSFEYADFWVATSEDDTSITLSYWDGEEESDLGITYNSNKVDAKSEAESEHTKDNGSTDIATAIIVSDMDETMIGGRSAWHYAITYKEGGSRRIDYYFIDAGEDSFYKIATTTYSDELHESVLQMVDSLKPKK